MRRQGANSPAIGRSRLPRDRSESRVPQASRQAACRIRSSCCREKAAGSDMNSERNRDRMVSRIVSVAARILPDFTRQCDQCGIRGRVDLALQASLEMSAPFGKIGDSRSQSVRMKRETQAVDGRFKSAGATPEQSSCRAGRHQQGVFAESGSTPNGRRASLGT